MVRYPLRRNGFRPGRGSARPNRRDSLVVAELAGWDKSPTGRSYAFANSMLTGRSGARFTICQGKSADFTDFADLAMDCPLFSSVKSVKSVDNLGVSVMMSRIQEETYPTLSVAALSVLC